MATKVKQPIAAKAQGRVGSRPKPAPLRGVLPAREAAALDSKQAIHRGDRIALVVLLFGLLFMGLINLYDLVRALVCR